MSKLFLWVEKYRPRTVSDCILTDVNQAVFQGYVDNGEIPNLLLPGTAGIGKTTLAKALCEEIGADYYLINGSDEVVTWIQSAQNVSPLHHPRLLWEVNTRS